MIRHYCTLFDKNYLAKGLAMYHSLRRHSSVPTQLHVMAMDEDTFQILAKLKLPGLWVYHLDSFEKEMSLGALKFKRTWQEYCWTCASNLMEYIAKVTFDYLTYLDADIMFFSDPEAIFLEMDGRDIAITPHRFSSKRQHMLRNGIFNVAWVSAMNNEVGRRCVEHWASQCREWCFYRNEDDKFGDQKYLDEWPRLYGNRLHVINNIGVNLAPWNMDHYRVSNQNGHTVVSEPLSGLQSVRELVFFHFHEFRSPERLTDYTVTDAYRRLVYEPYIKEITECLQLLTRL